MNIKQTNPKTSTNALTGNPLLLKISTTLLPTPPVAPATSMIPEVSISLTGSSVVDPLVSFSNTDETNFTSQNKRKQSITLNFFY